MRKFGLFGAVLGLVLLTACGNGGAEVVESKESASTENQTVTETAVTDPYVAVMPTEAEEADIFVRPVEGISDDFIKGADISTVLVEEEAGAKYYNLDGEEEDLFKILADSGVNLIRVRVWVDPYDENGNGYGAGNCDADKAVTISTRAAAYGMKTMVDFHYSDFWADPSRQLCPKSWEGMSAAEKSEAAYTFTYETLDAIFAAGGDVSMVQVGNEINNGLAGETLMSSVTDIMAGGSKAVREIAEKYSTEIKVVVHYTDVQDSSNILSIAGKLKNYDLDYDVFGISYYPYWHGTFENMQNLMTKIQEMYGKETMVVETAYLSTEEDGDGTGNSVSTKDICDDYAASPQGQANAIRDICEAVSEVNGLGVIYWEPAWIPVDSSTWETLGTGWATSYAAPYDFKVGDSYGGSAWDNQAMFDFEGHALPSINVWKYLKYGTISEAKVDFVNDLEVTVITGSEIALPETATVHFTDTSLNGEYAVDWNASDIAAIDSSVPGTYTVSGTVEGTEIKAVVTVKGLNVIDNASFEDSDRSGWEITEKSSGTVDYQQKESDAHSGEWAMHYWSSSPVSFTVTRTFTGLDNGTYTFSMYAQGGDNGSNASMYIFANAGGQEYKEDYMTDGWIDWKNPTITGIEVTDGTLTIGVTVDASSGAWGTFDDFYLSK